MAYATLKFGNCSWAIPISMKHLLYQYYEDKQYQKAESMIQIFLQANARNYRVCDAVRRVLPYTII